jgi:hypothetical protein
MTLYAIQTHAVRRTSEREHSGLTLLFLCGSLGADCGDLARGRSLDLAERPMLAVVAGLYLHTTPGAAVFG